MINRCWIAGGVTFVLVPVLTMAVVTGLRWIEQQLPWTWQTWFDWGVTMFCLVVIAGTAARVVYLKCRHG